MLNPTQRRMQQQMQVTNQQPHFQQQSLYGTNHSSTHQQPSDLYSTEDDPKYYQVTMVFLFISLSLSPSPVSIDWFNLEFHFVRL